MRRSAPAPRPRHLHSAPARNFRPPSPPHSAFETRPAQIPRGPPRRRPCPHSRNSPPPARYSGHRLPAEVGPPERAAAQPVCCFQRHTRSAASRAPRQFRTPGKCQSPASSFAAATRTAIPRASAVYELFPSPEYLRSYHTRLLPLNAFAGPLARTGERIEPSGVLLNDSTHPGKLLPAVRRYCYLVRESCFFSILSGRTHDPFLSAAGRTRVLRGVLLCLPRFYAARRRNSSTSNSFRGVRLRKTVSRIRPAAAHPAPAGADHRRARRPRPRRRLPQQFSSGTCRNSRPAQRPIRPNLQCHHFGRRCLPSFSSSAGRLPTARRSQGLRAIRSLRPCAAAR